jgi:hypothetical protein
MKCPRCGTDLLPGNTFCHRCRTRVGEAAGPSPASTQPPEATVGLRPRRARGRAVIVAALVLATAVTAATMAVLSRRRSRVAQSEAAAVTELRQVLHAEMAYAQANGGRYDRLECLARPHACIPRYPAESPQFLSEEAARLDRRREGYRFVFYAGPAPEWTDAARTSRSSLAAFAYVAVPDGADGAGGRSFCTDASRRVCALKSRDAHALAEGACPLTCVELK